MVTKGAGIFSGTAVGVLVGTRNSCFWLIAVGVAPGTAWGALVGITSCATLPEGFGTAGGTG